MPKTVKLYTLDWGQKFKLDGDTYEYERGNGMYPWVRNVATDVRYSMYIAQEVTPL